MAVNLIVVSYDVSHPRRLRRVARILEGFGERVQESVFECWLTPERLAALQQEIGREIDATADRVRYYSLCVADARDAQTLGVGGVSRDRVWVEI